MLRVIAVAKSKAKEDSEDRRDNEVTRFPYAAFAIEFGITFDI